MNETERKKMQNISTSQLLRELNRATNFEKYLQKHGDIPEPVPLHVYLQNLCRERGKLPADIIKKADLETSYGYQIFKGKRNPSRDIVIRLIFGFGLNLEQAQLMLKYARMHALYPKVKRDAVVIYCLQHRMSLWEAQNILNELDLPMIGEHKNG